MRTLSLILLFRNIKIYISFHNFVRCVVSIRDLLSWVHFINKVCTTEETSDDSVPSKLLSPEEAYIHGACLVFIDAIGSGNTAQIRSSDIDSIRKKLLIFLCNQVGRKEISLYNVDFTNTDDEFGFGCFSIQKGNNL